MIQIKNDENKPQSAAQGGDAQRTAWSSGADGELDRLYSAISSRKTFSYDTESDPVYRSYARQYDMNGRRAMKNSMGQAAALTGGYGSSYSAAVGQQQYDEYMRALSDTLPELYKIAYQRYEDEGSALKNQYDMAYQRREADFQRSEADYRRQKDEQEALQRMEQQEYSRRQDSYSSLIKLISGAGYSPTDEELNQAGMTRAQAQALLDRYLMDNGLLDNGAAAKGGGSGGRSKKKNSSSKNSLPIASVYGAATGLKVLQKTGAGTTSQAVSGTYSKSKAGPR